MWTLDLYPEYENKSYEDFFSGHIHKYEELWWCVASTREGIISVLFLMALSRNLV